jgi:hypothetical protein
MQIGATDATRSDFDQDFMTTQLAEIFVGDLELMRFLEECDFHIRSELKNDMLSIVRTPELYRDASHRG